MARGSLQQLLRLPNHVLDREPQLPIDPLVRRGRAEALEPQHHAVIGHPAVRRLRSGGLHRQPGGHGRRQHRIAIVAWLAREELHARHADRAGRDPAAASVSYAPSTSSTSEPLAIRITAGLPPGASASTYAPSRSPAAGAW